MENNNNGGKILKVLYNQVALVLAVGAFLWGFLNFINNKPLENERKIAELSYKLNTEVALTSQLQRIKDNDLTEIKAGILELKNQQIETIKEITKLETIINLKLK